MPRKEGSGNYLVLSDAPAIDGLRFRRGRDEKDYAKIADVINASWNVDLIDARTSPEEIANGFKHNPNFEPEKDALLVEIDNRLVGYANVTWQTKANDVRVYFQMAYLLPEFRIEGLRECMVRHNERRASAIASFHSGADSQWIETCTNAKENHWKTLIERIEYRPAWYLYGMVRPLSEEIPELPLPEGIEVRPVRKEDLWQIWRGAREAFKDGREYSEERWSRKAFENRNRSRTFDPTLWQVAWEGDEVVGGIHNHIDNEENESFERLWGHTEMIFVRKAWRGKGIAKGLISRSFRVLKQRGMESAVLDVDSENPSGALGLYESLGYKPYAEFIFYRKPVV